MAKHDSGRSACGHWEKNGRKASETPGGWRRDRREASCIGVLGSERRRICRKAVEGRRAEGPGAQATCGRTRLLAPRPRRSSSTREVWFPRCPAVPLPAPPRWGLRVRSKRSGRPLIGAPSVCPTPWPVGSVHASRCEPGGQRPLTARRIGKALSSGGGCTWGTAAR